MGMPSEGRCRVADKVASKLKERALKAPDTVIGETLREIGQIVYDANTEVQREYLEKKRQLRARVERHDGP